MFVLLWPVLAAEVVHPDAAMVFQWDQETVEDGPLGTLTSTVQAAALSVATGRVHGCTGAFVVDEGALYELTRLRASGVDFTGWTEVGVCGEGCVVWESAHGQRVAAQGEVLLGLEGAVVPSVELLGRVMAEAPPPARMTPAHQALMDADEGLLVRTGELRTWAVLSGTRMREEALVHASAAALQEPLYLAGAALLTRTLPLLGDSGREVEDLLVRAIDGQVQVVGSLTKLGVKLRKGERRTRLPVWEGESTIAEGVWGGDLLRRLNRAEPLPVSAEAMQPMLRACGPACAWSLASRPTSLLRTLVTGDLPRRGLRGARVVVLEDQSTRLALRLATPWAATRIERVLADFVEVERDGQTLTTGDGWGAEDEVAPGFELRVDAPPDDLAWLALSTLSSRVEHGAVVVDLGKPMPLRAVDGWSPVGAVDQPVDGCLSRIAAADLTYGVAFAEPARKLALMQATAEVLPGVADACAAEHPNDPSLQILQGQAHTVRGLLMAGFYVPEARADLEIGCGRGQTWACSLASRFPVGRTELVPVVNLGPDTAVAAVWATAGLEGIEFVDGLCAFEDAACLQARLPPVPEGDRQWLGLFVHPDLDPAQLAVLGDVTRERGWEWAEAVLGATGWAGLQLYPLRHAESGRHALVVAHEGGWTAVTTAALPALTTDDPTQLAAWVDALARVDGFAQIAIDADSWHEAARTADALQGAETASMALALVTR